MGLRLHGVGLLVGVTREFFVVLRGQNVCGGAFGAWMLAVDPDRPGLGACAAGCFI